MFEHLLNQPITINYIMVILLFIWLIMFLIKSLIEDSDVIDKYNSNKIKTWDKNDEAM